VFCEQSAGAAHTLTDSVGAAWGVCSFGPTAAVDEWTLFRASTPTGRSGGGGSSNAARSGAVAAFLNGPALGASSNAAATAVCAKAGAQLRKLTCAAPGCKLGAPTLDLCLFPDGSMVGADALRAGPKGAGGVARLAAVLTGEGV
jgi:putative hemolysin